MPHGIDDTTPDADPDGIDRPDWLDDQVWPFAIRTFHHDGKRIHYVDEGDGPTVVFVHAGMWSFVWRDLIRRLATDFRCLALDFPGAGLSDGGRSDIDLAAFATLTSEWLDHLGVDRATLVVHDLGGVVGVVAAAHRPERVTGIVAVNSFAWPPDKRALRAMLKVMGSRTATGLLGTIRLVPRMSRTGFGVGSQLDRVERRAFFGPYRSRARSRNFHRAMRSAAHSADLFDAAQRHLATTFRGRPAMTVFGEKNDPFEFAATWHGLFPHATAHVIEGGNHFPMCDAPDAVAAFLRDWHAADVGQDVAIEAS